MPIVIAKTRPRSSGVFYACGLQNLCKFPFTDYIISVTIGVSYTETPGKTRETGIEPGKTVPAGA